MRRALIIFAAAIAIMAGALVAYATLRSSQAPQQFKAVDATGASWGKGFELTDHHGRKRKLEDFRGKVVMLFFGYAQCPDVCPTTLAVLGEAMRQMGRDSESVQVLFVTVDAKRDTPELLARYVPAFFPLFPGPVRRRGDDCAHGARVQRPTIMA